MLTMRAFEAADAEDLLGQPLVHSVGLTAELNGKIAGFGALHRPGDRLWAIVHLYDERLRKPVLLHRIARKTLGALSGSDWRPLFAISDPARPKAAAWLKRLGFTDTGQRFGAWYAAAIG